MSTCTACMDALKVKLGITSDYALAKRMGWTQSGTSGYRSGRHKFDDETAAKVAQLLGIDEGFLICTLYIERAKTDEQRQVWESLRRAFPVPEIDLF